MPKGSEALTRARIDEIVGACAALYETMSFKDITIRDIGERTSFTRTSIYNYFQTKEEIFLVLLQREYEAWAADLRVMIRDSAEASAAGFSDALARTLERRGCMLKLMTMNIYDMERCSRLENLVAFKRAYAGTLEVLRECLRRCFPSMTGGDIQDFLYALLPFLFGVYPYTTATEKQRRAMEEAGVPVPPYTIYSITKSLVEKLLWPFTSAEAGNRHQDF